MTKKPLSLRNVGIIAHVDAGKTTLTERILHLTGQIHATGEVHHGNTTTDFGEAEQKMGITISAAAVNCLWRDATIQIIDTPGHADFTIEVERSLRVLDGAVLLLDAVAGVEPQTETVWRQATDHGVSAIAFINKLDRAGADFDRAVLSLQEELPGTFVPLQFPLGTEEHFEGLVDLVHRRALHWRGEDLAYETGPVPSELMGEVEGRRRLLIEAIAEQDEALLERFVLDAEVDAASLAAAIRRTTLAGLVVPVLGGSAFRHRGVQPLMDAIVDYLPAPEEQKPVQCAAQPAVRRARSEDAPLSALCFKVVFDDHAPLCFVRVYSGHLEKGQTVQVSGRSSLRSTYRVGRIVRLFADQRKEVSTLRAGEIGALVGADLVTGSTLCDPHHPIVLERVEAPPAVISMALTPATQDDRKRLPKALSRLLIEDPSLRIVQNADTGETTLAGMGQLHLEVSALRLHSQHHVKVDLGPPRVAYRESIREAAQVVHRHIKQSGGPGQFAVLTLRVEPYEGDFEFVDATRGGVLLREYVRGIEKGCRGARTHGVVGAYPVTGIRVTLVDGQMHSNDSSEHAFELAGAAAFRLACAKANPVLLEPNMDLEIRVPDDFGGAILGDIGARRGQVVAVDIDGGMRRIEAHVPLAELFSYANALGSMSSGRGSHSMRMHDYAPVPDALVEGLLR